MEITLSTISSILSILSFTGIILCTFKGQKLWLFKVTIMLCASTVVTTAINLNLISTFIWVVNTSLMVYQYSIRLKINRLSDLMSLSERLRTMTNDLIEMRRGLLPKQEPTIKPKKDIKKFKL